MSESGFELSRNSFGRLIYRDAGGEYENVLPVRAFPISAPQAGVSLLSPAGNELVWIADLAQLPPAVRELIEAELAQRELMPEIVRIVAVNRFAMPSEWQVETNRGHTTLVLNGEEAIRRLPQQALLIADSHGLHYLIRDVQALDKPSRKWLDRFL